MTNSEPVEAEVEDENAVAPQATHLASTQTVTHEYLTQSGKVMRETVKTDGTVTSVLDFIYDESGKPFAMVDQLSAQPKTYYYVLNLQGDVVKLIDQDGTEAAAYAYDAWGNILSQSGSMASANPLRYRGYYYDSETGFYYLQSRYYDPTSHRFINADVYTSTGQGFVGTNMFAYCNNNPTVYADNYGRWSNSAITDTITWLTESMEEAVGSSGELALPYVIVAGAVVGTLCVFEGIYSICSNVKCEDIPMSASDYLVLDAMTDEDALTQIASSHGLYKCKEAANEMQQLLEDRKKHGTVYIIQFTGSGKFNNVWSESAHCVVSTNGYHCGVEYNGKVYCNIHPFGLPTEVWKNDFIGFGEKKIKRVIF